MKILILGAGQVGGTLAESLANEAFDVTPSSGKISLQVEGAEMDFRRFELHPLDKSAGIRD